MATQSALEKRLRELRTGTATGRITPESYLRGSTVYSQGGSPNPSGSNQYTPYNDTQYNLQVSDIERQRQRARSGATSALSRLQSDWQQTTGELKEAHGDSQTALKQRMADQGILRSGINVDQQGEIDQVFFDEYGRLARDVATQREDIERGLATAESDLETNLLQAQFDRAMREFEQRLEQARVEAQIIANRESTAALQEEMAAMKNVPQANNAGKYLPNGTTRVVQHKRSNSPSKKLAQSK